MKIRMVSWFAAMMLASSAAFAFHFPMDMKKIDEALKTTKVTGAQVEEVKKQRAEGEKLHAAGKHRESIDVLARAMKTLGI